MYIGDKCMKKKLLSFILAVCFIIPQMFTLFGCGANPGGDNPQNPTAPHVHSWSEEWSSNYTKHWHACSGCDEKKDITTHTIDGYICTICGYDTWHTCQYE